MGREYFFRQAALDGREANFLRTADRHHVWKSPRLDEARENPVRSGRQTAEAPEAKVPDGKDSDLCRAAAGSVAEAVDQPSSGGT
jgi:hypothetical protein